MNHDPPLAGLRVLDFSRVLAGPLCTMILGDLGAEVIKVERPGSGDDTRAWGPPWAGAEQGRESAYFLAINRNKRSLTADLEDPGARRRLLSLAQEADVVVENFAPGKLVGWGLDHASLAARNPRLIFCSITGYGSDGAEAERPGYDFAVQARAGWMAITGEPREEPVKVGVAVVDVLTGQNAALAILAALHERERSGRGQRVEVALLDSALAGLVNVAQAALVTGREPERWGNAHATIVPYQAFATADHPIVVAVGNDAQWVRLCGVLGVPELGGDARYASNPQRVERRAELVPRLAERLLRHPAAFWLPRLDAAAIPCARVQGVAAALQDPTFRERGGCWSASGSTYGEVEMVASPLRFGRTPGWLRRAPPTLGEHDDEIAREGWDTAPY